MTHPINLRPATIADTTLLQHWDEQPHVIESDPNDDWILRLWKEGCSERAIRLFTDWSVPGGEG